MKTRVLLRSQVSRPLGLRLSCWLLLTWVSCTAFSSAQQPPKSNGARTPLRKVRWLVRDSRSQPIACHLFLTDQSKQIVKPRETSAPFWKDHICIDGSLELQLPSGHYHYVAERGPEWSKQTGSFSVSAAPSTAHQQLITLSRRRDLASEGWYSGDLHVHRPIEQIEPLMKAADLHVAPIITWWNRTNPWKDHALPPSEATVFDRNRFYSRLAGEDERGGGALIYYGLNRPIDITQANRETPSSVHFLAQAKAAGQRVHASIEKPFWKDVPLWLARGQVDSIGLAHNHMWRRGVLDNEAWGRTRDLKRWPGNRGNGEYSQFLYYQILNAGIALPPVAGSASGVLPNPVGYNRVYAFVEGDLDYRAWWQAVEAGQVTVSNGPLLTVRCNNQLPGHRFRNGSSLRLTGKLTSDSSVKAIQIVHNGKVIDQLPVPPNGQLSIEHALSIEDPGWFLVRAISDDQSTFHFASTGPFYLHDQRDKLPISRSACELFLNWAKQRQQELRAIQAPGMQKVLQDHQAGIDFWQQRLDSASSP